MRNKWIVPLFLLGISFIFAGILLNNKSLQVLVSKTQEANILPSTSDQPLSNSVETPTLKMQGNLVKVEKVIDGDTIQVLVNGKMETIRLIGIDTPETVDSRKPVQCFGKEASAKAKEILAGKDVSLESDLTQGDKDKYGRLLRFVFLENGTSFNKMMIREGYAHEYTYSVPYKYQLEYKQAEKEARDNDLGLWSPSACSQSLVSPSPAKVVNENDNYACDCSKLCPQIKTCDEAYYQLNSCGCTKRDADSDGVPCESLCR